MQQILKTIVKDMLSWDKNVKYCVTATIIEAAGRRISITALSYVFVMVFSQAIGQVCQPMITCNYSLIGGFLL